MHLLRYRLRYPYSQEPNTTHRSKYWERHRSQYCKKEQHTPTQRLDSTQETSVGIHQQMHRVDTRVAMKIYVRREQNPLQKKCSFGPLPCKHQDQSQARRNRDSSIRNLRRAHLCSSKMSDRSRIAPEIFSSAKYWLEAARYNERKDNERSFNVVSTIEAYLARNHGNDSVGKEFHSWRKMEPPEMVRRPSWWWKMKEIQGLWSAAGYYAALFQLPNKFADLTKKWSVLSAIWPLAENDTFRTTSLPAFFAKLAYLLCSSWFHRNTYFSHESWRPDFSSMFIPAKILILAREGLFVFLFFFTLRRIGNYFGWVSGRIFLLNVMNETSDRSHYGKSECISAKGPKMILSWRESCSLRHLGLCWWHMHRCSTWRVSHG